MRIVCEQAELGADGEHQGELAQHMLAHLLCSARHTVTGLLEALGREQQDWSKAYRLYRDHVDCAAVFSPVLDGVLDLLEDGTPLVLAVDDSHFRKTGKKVAAAGWYRDPLGPGFHTNLMYAHRFIQLSAAVPDPAHPKRARMIPIAMELIPKLPKPAKDAPKQDWDHYEKMKALNTQGAHAERLLARVRSHLAASCTHAARSIWICGDAHYSTSSFLPYLPADAVYIGRARLDMHLCRVPDAPEQRSAGRPRSYGDQLPTPDELRKNRAVPYQKMTVFTGEETTTVRVKHIPQAKWRVAGEAAIIQVLVIAPLRYKKRKDGPWCYTRPTYLVCTDVSIPLEEIIQTYFWRWGIEVNFKEQKQLFGAGQAQVRHSISVSTAPAVCIATYAALQLAGIRAYGFHSRPTSMSPPKWNRAKLRSRITSSDLIKQLHRELSLAGAANFSPFSFAKFTSQNGQKLQTGRAA